MSPLKISVVDKSVLNVVWDDNKSTEIKLANLRRKCPCAICNAEKSEKSSKYIPIFTLDQLTVDKIIIVGSYAIGITWKDGHNTGIYDYNYLRNISRVSGEMV